MKRLAIIAFIFIVSSVGCTTMKPGTISNGGLSALGGTWELVYISGPRIAFNGLYPAKRPSIKFDISEKRFSGNTSCNSFSGTLSADDTTIDFTQPFMMTKMACPGEGEAIFVEMLRKVNRYEITADTALNFMTGDITMMRFNKK
ncbi:MULTISPECIES: META domain-containing protein [Pedobacter]|uniref:META domain-containing protein n=1 Tax=Pedobacter TaxID=84567 RepID=UPI00210A83AF|nr:MULTISPECIES: META domain-containing protein [unclassified Pedobacter]